MLFRSPPPTSPPSTSPPSSPPSTPPIPYPWKCPAGQYPYYYSSSWTDFFCRQCNQGDTFWPAGDYSCTGCQAMYRLTEAKDGCEGAGPLKCKPGYYGRNYGGYFLYPCDKCPAGTYRNNDSYMISCKSCPVGSLPNADQSNCVTGTTPAPTSAPTN